MRGNLAENSFSDYSDEKVLFPAFYGLHAAYASHRQPSINVIT